MNKYKIFRINRNFYEVCFYNPQLLNDFINSQQNQRQIELICLKFEQKFFEEDMFKLVKDRKDISLNNNTYMYNNAFTKEKSYLQVNDHYLEFAGKDFEYPFAKILLLTNYNYLVYDLNNNISFWLS